MKSFKRDLLLRLEEDVSAKIGSEYEPIHRFEVVPLDYNVVDYTSPLLLLYPEHLVFTYDDSIEVYNLDELEIDIIGSPPSFALWQVMIEPSQTYTPTSEDLFAMRTSEYMLKVSIKPQNMVNKDFLLRSGELVAKSYKTWAMGRILLNHKNKIENNPLLFEMMEGNFQRFNRRTLLYFSGITLIYFMFFILLRGFLPSIINSALDVFFGVILLFMGYWLYVSLDNELKRFRTVYFTYMSSDRSA